MAIFFSERWSPPDEMISRPQMPCRRTEGKACNRPVRGKSHVLEVLPHGLGVSEIMVLLDEAVEEFFQGGSSHLMNRDGKKLPQRFLDRASVDLDPFRRTSLQERIERNLFPWGKTDGALTFQIQQEPTADHVLGLPVLLGPVPCKAQPPRQGTAPFLRVFGDHLPDQGNVGRCKSSVSVSECVFHA